MDSSRSHTDLFESGIKTPAATILSPDNGQRTTSFDEKTDEPEYITGLALVASLSALTLAIYLMLLDTSIVSTVSFPSLLLNPLVDCQRQFLKLRPTSIPLVMSAGMEPRT